VKTTASWLSVALFGGMEIRVRDEQGRDESVALTGRPRKLLAYLALSRRITRHRHELTDVLWSDQDDATRAGSFNTTLWRLRQAIERPPLRAASIVICDRSGAVALCGEDQLRTDLDVYARLVAPALAKQPQALSERDVADLEQGVVLYSGDVLAGVDDHWALREREKHRRMQLNALGRLLQVDIDRANVKQGIGRAQAILDMDPLREDVHRALIMLFMQSGQRARALMQFECCRDILRRELAIMPMPETVSLYQQISDGAITPAVPSTGVLDLATPAGCAELAASTDEPPVAGLAPSAAACDSASALVASARQQLAGVDAQLQLLLPLLARDHAGSSAL
jgi:DNA-binding SARP family transcriptional activator